MNGINEVEKVINIIKESLEMPVDNFLGMLIYAIIFMFFAGVIALLALKFIPNRLPYGAKSAIVFAAILISLFLWWQILIRPSIS
ncbi:hypothetical protein [Gracilibacillus sp. YIM 98692]|uniref:hypothetical protein n=1 Tax=Gracilibacillus sp. YIM 98692 TaxID=2663532 RepID=UPI001F09392C|nr:hypothetical protein [Gracilibacillus sp. YIM 98692]